MRHRNQLVLDRSLRHNRFRASLLSPLPLNLRQQRRRQRLRHLARHHLRLHEPLRLPLLRLNQMLSSIVQSMRSRDKQERCRSTRMTSSNLLRKMITAGGSSRRTALRAGPRTTTLTWCLLSQRLQPRLRLRLLRLLLVLVPVPPPPRLQRLLHLVRLQHQQSK